MGLWLELHCDHRLDPVHPLGPTCYTHGNEHPGILVGNRQVDAALEFVVQQARAQGWIQVGRTRQWMCPGCQKIQSIRRRTARNG